MFANHLEGNCRNYLCAEVIPFFGNPGRLLAGLQRDKEDLAALHPIRIDELLYQRLLPVAPDVLVCALFSVEDHSNHPPGKDTQDANPEVRTQQSHGHYRHTEARAHLRVPTRGTHSFTGAGRGRRAAVGPPGGSVPQVRDTADRPA